MENSEATSIGPQEDEGLPKALHPFAVRAAIEGIPVAAIGRILAHPLECIYVTLQDKQASGEFCDMPRADWPPSARLADRLPDVKRKSNDSDLQFSFQKLFRLTNLEAAFLVTLMRVEHADKTMLHHVIEATRYNRAAQPDSMDVTDPKMVDVMICKLRKKLKLLDARFAGAIVTIWGGGYYVDPKMKALLLAALGAPDEEKPPAEVAA